MFQPDQKLEQEIDRWIAEKTGEFVEDIGRLVAIPSISEAGKDGYPYGKACAEVLDEAAALAGKYGFSVRNHEYHCGSLVEPGKRADRRRIGMFAHLDVVPLGEGWEYPPLACTQKDGYLIGRGVGDNKGPAMCALYALRFLKEHGIRLDNDVLLYFGCSEETGMADVEYFCETQKAELPDLCLVTDTNFPVCYGEKGLFRADITKKISGNLVSLEAGSVVNVIPAKAEAVLSGVCAGEVKEKLAALEQAGGAVCAASAAEAGISCAHETAAEPKQLAASGLSVEETDGGVKITAAGVSKHAAFPEGSVNAIHVLTAALSKSGLVTGSAAEAVSEIAALTADCYGCTTGIPFEDQESGKLTCVGSVLRLSDGVLRLSFDVRYPVTIEGKDVEAGFRKTAEALGFSTEVMEMSAPAYMPLDRPYIPLLSDVCNYVLKKQYEPYTMGGGTYSRKLPNGIGFGPGVPDMVNPFPAGHGSGHQPDECIELRVLLNGLKVYILALLELDKLF